MFRDVPGCSGMFHVPDFIDAPRKSGLAEAVNRPNLTFAVSPKYLSNETKIYIFITRIPRVVYMSFWGFFKNFIFPTSGRYLQTSALKRRTGKKEASFFDHLNCCSDQKTWKDCITNQSSFFTFNMQIVTFLFNSNFISLMLSSSQDFV